VVPEATQRAGREALNYTILRGGSTPLLFAARNGNAECARLLLEAGADPDESLPDGTSALVLAAHSGHGDVGILLLEKGADPNAFGTGYTALHAAVLRSQVPLVKSLLAHGADPNIRMTKGTPMRRQTTDFNLPFTLIGSTPYFLAAKFVEAEAMKALVAGGADPNLAMPDGTTPLMAAAGKDSQGRRSRRGIAAIDIGGDIEPESQVLEAVAAAIELGGDINATDEGGDTALHSAAGRGYDTVVQFLAEHGADLDVKNKRGRTALAIALNPPGRRRRPVADLDDEGPPEVRGSSTAELLRKLGASE
jgi:ankyrin repeat protein